MNTNIVTEEQQIDTQYPETKPIETHEEETNAKHIEIQISRNR